MGPKRPRRREVVLPFKPADGDLPWLIDGHLARARSQLCTAMAILPRERTRRRAMVIGDEAGIVGVAMAIADANGVAAG